MNLTWLLRMAKWARNPPSPRQVKLVLAVVALCFAIWGYELYFGWPEALRVNGKVRY
jgi:hypothetical protein